MRFSVVFNGMSHKSIRFLIWEMFTILSFKGLLIYGKWMDIKTTNRTIHSSYFIYLGPKMQYC